MQTNQTAHPDTDILELYALHRLTDEQDRVLERHIYGCCDCQRHVITLTRQAQLIRAVFRYMPA